MFNGKKIKGMILVSLSLALLTACGTPAGNIAAPGDTGNTTVNTPVGSLTFSKVSAQNKALFDSAIAQQSSSGPNKGMAESDNAAGVATPVAPSVGADMAIAPGSARMAAPLSYFPMPGFFEEYVVTNTEEAKTAGFTGTFLETLDKIVKPLITGLGSDSRLVNSSGSTDKEGLNKPVAQPSASPEKPSYYYSPYQWQYTFVSSANKEVYTIFVSDNETLVIRQKWGLRNLDLNSVKVDSNTAIKTVTDAIKDREFKSPEGDQQAYYGNPNEKQEILYEIPEKGTWYFYLNQENDSLVWNVSLNVYEASMPAVEPMMVRDIASDSAGSSEGSSGGGSVGSTGTQTVTNSWVSGGYARIDAQSGKILSLVRPMKYTYTYETKPMPIPDRSPMPSDMPIPVEPDGGIGN